MILKGAKGLDMLYQQEVYQLLEMGISIHTFSANSNRYENLIHDIQTFRVRVLSVIRDALILDLSNIIVDYSLK